MKFAQYDEVKLIKIINQKVMTKKGWGYRDPEVGDIATIIEIYSNPEVAYHLECNDENGATAWDLMVIPDDIELKTT
ncbi:hypothetical protein [uncultured Shewanella sp.]|uniref:hypothetical protein n=1 Tax=uncultured Shewanella sp. TaxID=173975 RepID=UPI0026131FDF|nr:hypothetical protein [uncultured Shewanella sp.]